MVERIHLAILKAIDEHGTLTEAASALCLTQSALSHSIKKLEQQLNIRLWNKEGRNLRFTQAGQYLLNISHQLLPQLVHAEEILQQYAIGKRGSLRIGMECHPCYKWLLRVVSPFLEAWPDVDIDVRQQFQFGGLDALRHHEIDLLITPDPVHDSDLTFQPIFDYELVLVVANNHPLATKEVIAAEQLSSEVLITYPVATERLDIYSQFLLPNNSSPKQHITVETTDIMLHLVAAGRGVTALPAWLVDQYNKELPISAIRLGEKGIHKQIFVGRRNQDSGIDYLSSFIELAHRKTPTCSKAIVRASFCP